MNQFEQIIWGGLVADAATMGFHWLYDQERVRKAGGDTPEFHDPDPTLYQLNHQQDSTFVHHGKRAGDITQYGEQLLVMLRALANHDGELNQAAYEKEFARVFGSGGPYVGYIDRPTEVVLYNLKKRERDAYADARSFESDLTDEEKGVLDDEVMVKFKFYDEGLNLEENLELLDRWVLIKQDYKRDNEKDKQRIAYCRHMFNVVYQSNKQLCGDVGDDQFPAIVKLPPIVALYHDKVNFADMVALATRLTNNNEISVRYAKVYAAMLAAAIETREKDAVLLAAKANADAEIREMIDAALARIDQPNTEVAHYFGLSCHLPYGLPQNIHLIANCDNYVDAIRMNILAAGDNAGRSVMLGAIYAALYGIDGEQGLPSAWIDKVSRKREIVDLLTSISAENTIEENQLIQTNSHPSSMATTTPFISWRAAR